MRYGWLVLLLAGCGSSSSAPTDSGIAPEDRVFGGDRPVTVFRSPEGADPNVSRPLVVVLHGYGASGLLQSIYFRLDKLVDEKNFLLAAPDGMPDSKGSRFWAAVDGCCESAGKKVDDVKYLTSLVTEIGTVWKVDPKRVYLVGHSNGGAMAYRLACEPNQPFAAAFVLAPAFFEKDTVCKPNVPISIRHVHGTADTTVPYDGGSISLLGPTLTFPSAPSAVATFAKLNGCSDTPDESAAPLDLDKELAGAETTSKAYKSCRNGVVTELLTMAGGKHMPVNLTTEIGREIWSWLEAHPRP